MKKGCLLTFASAVLLVMIVVIGGCRWLAAEYEKRPKKPGEAEFTAIDDDLMIYNNAEAFGNSPEARDMALRYARALRMARQVFFTEGKASSASLSKGHFITYCSLSTNKCAFVVHVPELRRYAPDAKVSMAEMAWRMAVENLRSAKLETKELAVGIRGVMDYAWIFVGTTDATNAMDGIRHRHDGISREPLYPFFIGAPRPFPASTNAPASAPSRSSG